MFSSVVFFLFKFSDDCSIIKRNKIVVVFGKESVMVYNFGAGPSVLPQEVLKKAQKDLLDFENTGMSVLEISHRSQNFQKVIDEAEKDLRELMGIPGNYKVLFLQGGASTQFSMVPLNLAVGKKAYYAISGAFGKKAYDEAVKLSEFLNLEAISLGSTEAEAYKRLVNIDECQIDKKNAAYLHLTTNNTIEGTTVYPEALPEGADVPLVADMSSNILAVDYEVEKFGLIYAGAQKNLGAAGLTLVIVREDLLNAHPTLSSMMDYQILSKNGSMYNTPPTFAIYLAGLVFKWAKKQGGVKALEANNRKKAQLLYDYIDQSGFYQNPVVNRAQRSICNVVFTSPSQELDALFAKEAANAGFNYIKGHRSVGGMRASIYNAFPLEGVIELIKFMKEFEEKYR